MVAVIDSGKGEHMEPHSRRNTQPKHGMEHFPVSRTHPASHGCGFQPALDEAAQAVSSEGVLEVSPRALGCPHGLPRPPVPAAAAASSLESQHGANSHRLFLTFAVSLGLDNEMPGFKCQLSRGDAIVFSSVPFS